MATTHWQLMYYYWVGLINRGDCRHYHDNHGDFSADAVVVVA